VLNSENDSICQNLCAVIPVSCNAHHQLVTDLHFDVFSSSLLRYAGYVPFVLFRVIGMVVMRMEIFGTGYWL
jgi:hypothetical protein